MVPIVARLWTQIAEKVLQTSSYAILTRLPMMAIVVLSFASESILEAEAAMCMRRVWAGDKWARAEMDCNAPVPTKPNVVAKPPSGSSGFSVADCGQFIDRGGYTVLRNGCNAIHRFRWHDEGGCRGGCAARISGNSEQTVASPQGKYSLTTLD